MLCLNDSIRYDDPSLQRLLSAVEETHTLTALLLAVWPLARTLAIHIVESVLAARAQAPTCWPPCPTCGTPLRSKGFATRQVTSLFGPLRWRRRVGRCPHGDLGLAGPVGRGAGGDDEVGDPDALELRGTLRYLAGRASQSAAFWLPGRCSSCCGW